MKIAENRGAERAFQGESTAFTEGLRIDTFKLSYFSSALVTGLYKNINANLALLESKDFFFLRQISFGQG